MLERKLYCEACDRLTLDAGKIEEMIIMTENQEKKAHRFPRRAALVAAALAAALCVTAAAAEVPAVQEFFTSIFVTITVKGEEVNGFNIPSVAVEERDGRSILLVNGEKTDITEALAQDKEYLYEGDRFQVAVDENGVAVVTAYGTDGTVITYSTEDLSGGTVVYEVTSDLEMEEVRVQAVDGDGGGFDLAEYEIVADQNGVVTVVAADEK